MASNRTVRTRTCVRVSAHQNCLEENSKAKFGCVEIPVLNTTTLDVAQRKVSLLLTEPNLQHKLYVSFIIY